MKGITKMLLAALMVLTIINPLMAASDDALLKMVPSDAVFCVRINQFNSSLGKMDQYLTGASPVPLAMMINMQLSGILGDPTLAAIDQNGTFMMVGIALDSKDVDMSLLVPMTDYQAFIKDNAACSPSGTEGVLLYKAANSGEKLAITAAPGGKYALVNSEENIAAMVTLQKQLASKTAKLAASLDADQAAQASSAPVWAYVNLARIYDLYGPKLLEEIEKAQQSMPQDAAMSDMMAINKRMMTEMVKTYFSQSDSATLALLPEQTVLNMDASFKAKDGSKMAGMFVANPQTETGFKLAGFADDNDAVNMVMKTNPQMIENFNNEMLAMMNTIAVDKSFTQDMEKIKALADKCLKAMGNEVFASFSYVAGQPPFRFREVIAVKEPDFFKKIGPEGIEAGNNIYKAPKIPATLNYTPGVEAYKDVPIDAIAIKFQAADSNDVAMGEIEKLYGPDGFTYYTAQKDKLAYIALGPDSKNILHSLIDTPADKAVGGDLQKAMTTLGTDAQKADMVASINVLKLFKGLMDIAGQMGGPFPNEMFAAMAKALNVPTQSCMAASSTIAKGKINSRIALPKQHLMEITTAAMAIQMQAMQQQTQGSTAGTAKPASSSAAPKDPLQEWVGKPAPDLKLTDLQGNKISLSELKGKKIMLDFWATWCPPCKAMIPSLIELRKNTNPEQLAMLAISDEPVDRLNKFAKDYKLNYTVISHDTERPAPYSDVQFLPTTVLIDSSGVIRHVILGSHELADLKAAIDGMQ